MDRERRILPEIKTPQRSLLVRRILTVCQVFVVLIACMAVIASFWGQSLRTLGQSLIAVAESTAAGIQVGHILTPDLDDKRRQAVVTASGIRIGSNMFEADPNRIRTRIETIDGIGSVHVARIWPETIIIVVQPRKAAALSSDGKRWAVLDRDGHVIARANPDHYKNVPRLFGVSAPATAAVFLSALEHCPALRRHLRLAEHVDGRRWDLHLSSGARLILPETDWRRRMTHVETLHRTYRLLDLNLNRIDTRVAHGIALTPPDRASRQPAPGQDT